MANKYITLSNSDSSLSKQFKATAMKTPWVRTDSVEIALDGSPDKAAGVILHPYQYVLRVPYQVAEGSDYGTLAELKTLFELNNPNATPSDVITLTDHYGTEHEVIFTGETSPDPVSTLIDGNQAFFLVNVTFMELSVTPGGSGS
jgi:hypothetical protein